MGNNLYTVSEEEKYFFDLRGYLVVRGALSEDEVKACNDAIDHYGDEIRARSIEDGGLARGSSALTGKEGQARAYGYVGLARTLSRAVS